MAAEEEADDLLEYADPDLLDRAGVPPIEDRDKPIGVGRPGHGFRLPRRRGRPGSVRQEEIQARGPELEEVLVHDQRVRREVDRAKDAGQHATELWVAKHA